MSHLETTFAGLQLKSPLIMGSCGLTKDIGKIVDISSKGVGAIVLKSLFEEQIIYDINKALSYNSDFTNANEYIAEYSRHNNLHNYLLLLKEAKDKTDIPIIASINCYNDREWISFAKDIENTGADALEVNVFFLPIDKNMSSAKYEQTYFDLLISLRKHVKIPIIFKLGSHFTNLPYVANRLNAGGISGLTLFNRFYEPDIDIDNLKLTASEIFSHPIESHRVVRWLALLSDKVKGLDISASTGVHDGKTAIKYLLAGAATVQLCSVVYKKGADIIPQIIAEIEQWMEEKKFDSIASFRGIMSYKSIPDPTMYERAQFVKYFARLE